MIDRLRPKMQIVATALTLGLLASCSVKDADRSAATPVENGQVPSGSAVLEATAFEGRWLITTFDGRPPVAPLQEGAFGRSPSVAFTRTGYGATAGCNSLGGIGTRHGERYYTMPGPQTLIGCQGALAVQENVLDAVMRASPTISTIGDGELQLTGGGHRLTLRRDSQSPAQPVEAAPMLAGARFHIISVDGVHLAPRSQTDRRPLAFDAETWRATPVCGTVSGKWRQDGWTLEASDITVSRTRCDASGPAVDTAIRELFASRPHFAGGPNGEILIAGGGHWLAAERDPAALGRDTPRLAGSWDIVRLDGRPPASETPATPPRLDFGATSYGGSTGCNSILGNFVARAGRLYTYPGPTTEKGCGALSAQENRIYALLRGSPRIGRSGNDVQLVDAAGSMVLRRAERPAQSSQAAQSLPTRYAGTAISLNGEPTQNRASDPASRINIAGNEVRIDIGCGMVSAVIRRDRDGMSMISNASSSDGSTCMGARLAQHNVVMRLVNGPVAGIVDVNGDLLLAGEGVWLTARRN